MSQFLLAIQRYGKICRSPAVDCRRLRQGISLIEVTVSTLLVGVVLVSALSCVGAATQSWRATSDGADAYALAMDLMGEITSQAYQDAAPGAMFGPESGETSPNTRAQFDDIDDYRDRTDTPPKDRNGVAIPHYSGWQRTADIRKLDTVTLTALADSAPDTGLRLIVVTVVSPSGKTTTLQTYRSATGGGLRTQGVAQTLITWAGFELETGGAARLSSGTAITNHAADL